MNPTLFEIERDGPGRLATMACPRGGDWVADEMAGLRAQGVNVLVSALTDSELVELRLTAEPELAGQAGLVFISFPIPDRGVPAAIAPVAELVGNLEGHLSAGQFVVVHCRAGIGRSSLLAAAILVHEGLTPDDVWKRISVARGFQVPDTKVQQAWLAAFDERHDVERG
jgi:protein-tyrosine phosphatase